MPRNKSLAWDLSRTGRDPLTCPQPCTFFSVQGKGNPVFVASLFDGLASSKGTAVGNLLPLTSSALYCEWVSHNILQKQVLSHFETAAEHRILQDLAVIGRRYSDASSKEATQ